MMEADRLHEEVETALGGCEELPDDWVTRTAVLREPGWEVSGESSGQKKDDKETWWWNEEIQYSSQRKRLARE